MITLDDAQIWTALGAFIALFGGALAIIPTLFVRVIRAEIGGLRGEMSAQLGGMRGEMHAQISGLRGEVGAQIGGLREEMNARFDAVHTRLDGMNLRVDNLDRDVQALVKHTFGLDRE